MSLVLKNISDAPADLDLLSRFYEGLYIAGFPDPNERESLANMKHYLSLRREGWYGPNSYHIILALDGDRTVAASVSDYLAKPNCGVIEFLLVDEAMRGTGIGKTVHAATIEAFDADARRAGRGSLDGVVIELNDPFRVAPQDDNYDPFERALIWDRWGYKRICFPYIQPALSEEQEPATCLLLAMKPIAARLQSEIPAVLAGDAVGEYMRWAMRIDNPEANPIFVEMRKFLSAQSTVPLEPLSLYIGRDPARPLSIKPVTRADDPDFKTGTDVYARAFPPGPTVIDVRMFAHALQWSVGRTDLHYHFWALANGPGEPIAGMASFFVMQDFAFGGYLAFEPPLRGTGRTGIVLKRIEEQIIRDEREARQHYIECVPNSSEEAVFHHLGFTPVPVRYVQPPTMDDEHFGSGEGPQITLLCKRLGSDYGRTPFSADQFLADLKVWLREVYRIDEPEESPTFRIAAATVSRV
jgi:GNAT superfamily N-acetyltransferase